MTRWEGVVAPPLKPSQFILKITASCNKRIKRVSTLIISSMKILWLRAPIHWASFYKVITEAWPL